MKVLASLWSDVRYALRTLWRSPPARRASRVAPADALAAE